MFRVKQYKQGWLAEMRKPKWTIFGIRYYWTHFVGFYGMDKEPFYFETPESALEAMKDKVSEEVSYNFKYGR